MNAQQGSFVFCIMDLVWSAVKLFFGFINTEMTADWVIRGGVFAEAILSAIFAALLLLGLRTKKWRFLLAYVIWQGFRIGFYTLGLIGAIRLVAIGNSRYWKTIGLIALFIVLMGWTLFVVEKTRRNFKESEKIAGRKISFQPKTSSNAKDAAND